MFENQSHIILTSCFLLMCRLSQQPHRETLKLSLWYEQESGIEVARFWAKPTVEQREFQKNQPGPRRKRQVVNFVGELIPFPAEDAEKILENANGGL